MALLITGMIRSRELGIGNWELGGRGGIGNWELTRRGGIAVGVGPLLVSPKNSPTPNSQLPTPITIPLLSNAEIITVFSARLYGSRSKKHRKLLQSLQEEADIVMEHLEVSSCPKEQ